MTKKSVLVVGFVSTLLIGSLILFDSHTCYINKYCNKVSDFVNQDNLSVIFIMPLIFLLSLVTYKMREEIFRAWWNFARWFAPVIVAVTFLQNMQSGGGGVAGVVGRGFDIFVLGVLYAVLIVVSLVQIVRTRRMLKGKK